MSTFSYLDSNGTIGKLFSVKDQTVNIIHSAGHRISVGTTEICCSIRKQPWTIDKQIAMELQQTLFTKSGSKQDLAHQPWFADSCSSQL